MTLVLKRKYGEKIEIIVPPSTTPTTVMVVMVGTDGCYAKLGFDADRSVQIIREEAIVRTPHESRPTSHDINQLARQTATVAPSIDNPPRQVDPAATTP